MAVAEGHLAGLRERHPLVDGAVESGGAPQLPTAAAPTNVGSAVQYAVLTARQNSSECARVDPAALSRWLLVHVTFDSTLGFPGEGPPKKGLVRSLSRTAH